MKLISETLVSRSKISIPPDYWKYALQINYGTERRYRRGSWDFLGLFDKYVVEWENKWTVTKIIEV